MSASRRKPQTQLSLSFQSGRSRRTSRRAARVFSIRPVSTQATSVETAVGRYKALIGPERRACRSLPAQQGEVAVAVAVLNRMIRLAKPISVRVA